MAEDVDDDEDLSDLCPQPMEIVTYKHAVVLVGPGPNSLAMTADAAERSGRRLLKAAKQARAAG